MTVKKSLAALIIFAAFLGAGFYYFRNEIVNLGARLPEIQNAADIFVGEIKKEISNPPPLRATREAPQAVLTEAGVVKFTNLERVKNGASALTVNTKLNASAELKAKDLFAKQYFEHVSPSGRDITDLAGDVGYAYLLIGENLALGNFENDEALVAAWMASPGHRENILNPRYSDIGVAVLKGTFEGRVTWVAVQHFGLPESACPLPDLGLKSRIDANKAQLSIWSAELGRLQSEIDSIRPKRGEAYNAKIDQYNQLADSYNKLLDETRVFIDEYNKQVDASNQCKAG